MRAAGFYQQAAASAMSDLARARFLLAEEQVRLHVGSVSDVQLDADRKNAAAYQGQKIGYGFTREYAIALNARGQRQQAVDVLRNGLRAAPAEERSEADHFRLLLGLIAGADAGIGRNELFELLSFGSDPNRQRIALQLLVRGPPVGRAWRAGAAREARPSHGRVRGPSPSLESLLLCRAQLLLVEAHSGLAQSGPLYSRAEEEAHALLERFPGSPLKARPTGSSPARPGSSSATAPRPTTRSRRAALAPAL